MSDLILHETLRLPRPIGVDWFKKINRERLEGLTPGEPGKPKKYVWLIIDGEIQCAQVTEPSNRFESHINHGKQGTQVYYQWRCGGIHHLAKPRLILDVQEIDLYRITDLHEAAEYYTQLNMSAEADISGPKLVINNKG